MTKTNIEWTDETWNPVSGCSKVSQGCKHCYAERMWGRLSAPGMPYTGRDFTDVQCHPERLDYPMHWKRPRLIFVNSMSDLFHENVPFGFIDLVMVEMYKANQHTFQILTKRPARMLEYMRSFTERRGSLPAVLPNVWLGVSVEDQETADERIPILLDTPASVRWISAEPLLGPIDLSRNMQWLKQFDRPPNIDWVVVGGESGPKARPMHPEWARSLQRQCAAANVAFLFKQWGEFAPDNSIYDDGSPFADAFRRNAVTHVCPGGERVYRVGKKRAGRTLDGKLWDEYPA